MRSQYDSSRAPCAYLARHRRLDTCHSGAAVPSVPGVTQHPLPQSKEEENPGPTSAGLGAGVRSARLQKKKKASHGRNQTWVGAPHYETGTYPITLHFLCVPSAGAGFGLWPS